MVANMPFLKSRHICWTGSEMGGSLADSIRDHLRISFTEAQQLVNQVPTTFACNTPKQAAEVVRLLRNTGANAEIWALIGSFVRDPRPLDEPVRSETALELEGLGY